MLGFDAPQLFSLPPGWAKAGIAMATIIAAMTNATVTNNRMRLIDATPFLWRAGLEAEAAALAATLCYAKEGCAASASTAAFTTDRATSTAAANVYCTGLPQEGGFELDVMAAAAACIAAAEAAGAAGPPASLGFLRQGRRSEQRHHHHRHCQQQRKPSS